MLLGGFNEFVDCADNVGLARVVLTDYPTDDPIARTGGVIAFQCGDNRLAVQPGSERASDGVLAFVDLMKLLVTAAVIKELSSFNCYGLFAELWHG